MKTAFSYQELLKVTNSTNWEIKVDLSSISIDAYPRLREALLKFAVRKIRRLEFNMNAKNTQAKSTKQKKGLFPGELGGSIAFQLPDFSLEIASLISRILFVTKSIHTLSVKSLSFSPCEQDILFQGLDACTTIKTLRFTGIPFGDEGFAKLSSCLLKCSVRDLQCRKCRLSDAIAKQVVKLVKYHSLVQKREEAEAKRERRKEIDLVCLSAFDFRENKLTESFIDAVTGLVDRSPVYKVDLRDNKRIEVGTMASPKFVIGQTPPKCAASSPDEKLRFENEKLKGRVDRLVGKKNVACVNNKIFIIGERAPELADHIWTLDRLCTKLDKAKGIF